MVSARFELTSRVNPRRGRFCVLVLLVFFFVYGIQFSFLPVYTSRLVAGIAAIWLTAYALLGLKAPSAARIATVIGVFCAYLVYVGLITVLSSARDINLFNNAVLTLGQVFVGAAFIGWLARYTDDPIHSLLYALQVAITIQGLFIIAYFLIIEFRQWTWEYLPAISNIDFESAFLRSRGLTNGGGATLSVVQSIGLMCSLLLLAGRNETWRLIYLLGSSTVILVSILLSGRTGLFVMPILATLVAWYVLVYRRIPNGWLTAAIAGPLLGVAAWLTLRSIFYAISGPAFGEDGFEILANWILEAFIRDGLVGSRTIDVLLAEHWHAPRDLVTLLFGDPHTWELNRIESDIGIIRRLYATGVIGTALSYMAVLLMCMNTTALWTTRARSLFLLTLTSWLFFVELKEPFLLKFEVLSILSLLYFTSYWSRSRPI